MLGHWRTQVVAGITTFFALSYVLVATPSILSEAGIDKGAATTATALTTALATAWIGRGANLPFVIGPGLGLNAIVAYHIVLQQGHTWQQALGVCFWSGIIVFVLTISGARRLCMKHLPTSLRAGTIAGLGLFLATTALQMIGIEPKKVIFSPDLSLFLSPPVIATAAGLLTFAICFKKKLNAALAFSVVATASVGWLLGDGKWVGGISKAPSVLPTLNTLSFSVIFDPTFWPLIGSLTAILLIDSIAALTALAEKGNFLTTEGTFAASNIAMTADSVGSVMGAFLGTSPCIVYIESSIAIQAGGRGKIVCYTVAALFLCSLFFAPFLASIPQYAPAATLLFVGALMAAELKKIRWSDPADFIPAYVIASLIPFTFNISISIAIGLACYIAIKMFFLQYKQIHTIVWISALLFGSFLF